MSVFKWAVIPVAHSVPISRYTYFTSVLSYFKSLKRSVGAPCQISNTYCMRALALQTHFPFKRLIWFKCSRPKRWKQWSALTPMLATNPVERKYMILAIPSGFSRWRTSAFSVSRSARLTLEDLPAGLQCSAAEIVIVLFIYKSLCFTFQWNKLGDSRMTLH